MTENFGECNFMTCRIFFSELTVVGLILRWRLLGVSHRIKTQFTVCLKYLNQFRRYKLADGYLFQQI